MLGIVTLLSQSNLIDHAVQLECFGVPECNLDLNDALFDALLTYVTL